MSDRESRSQGEQVREKRTWVEEIEVAGSQLVDRLQELVRESHTKRVVIRTQGGDELMSVPLTVGVVAGGLITLSAPLLAAVGAMAALLTRVKLEVIREEGGVEVGGERADESESEAVTQRPEDAPS